MIRLQTYNLQLIERAPVSGRVKPKVHAKLVQNLYKDVFKEMWTRVLRMNLIITIEWVELPSPRANSSMIALSQVLHPQRA